MVPVTPLFSTSSQGTSAVSRAAVSISASAAAMAGREAAATGCVQGVPCTIRSSPWFPT